MNEGSGPERSNSKNSKIPHSFPPSQQPNPARNRNITSLVPVSTNCGKAIRSDRSWLCS